MALPSRPSFPRGAVIFSPFGWEEAPRRVRGIARRSARRGRTVFVHASEAPRGAAATLSHRQIGRLEIVTIRVGRDGLDDVLHELLQRYLPWIALARRVGWYLAPIFRDASRHLPFSTVIWDRTHDDIDPSSQSDARLLDDAHAVLMVERRDG